MAVENIIGGTKQVISSVDPTKEGITDLEKILKGLIPTAAGTALAGGFEKSLGFVLEMDQSFAKLAQKMGVGQNASALIKENFAKSAEQIVLMGGKFEDSIALQEKLLSVTNKNSLVSSDIAAQLYATTKVTGVEVEKLQESFLDVGYETVQITEKMYQVQDIANKMGVSAQAVSSMVVNNLDKLNKYTFSEGVEGLAKMAGKAAMFRIDMSETFGLAEKLLSPENAIEVASALQRLGASTSQLASPLRLMDLAQNNVPELQNQLIKLTEKYTFFDEKTKSFQIMPGARKELKALEDSLGVSSGSLAKMSIEGAKLKKKMSEISFSGINLSKEQQEQVANLAELVENKDTKQMEYVVKYKDENNQQVVKAINQLTEKDKDQLDKFLKKQKEDEGKSPEEKMIKIAEEQLGKADIMIAKLSALQMAPQLAIAGGPSGEVLLNKAFEINQKNTESYLKANNFDTLSKTIKPAADSLVSIAEALGDGNFEKAVTEFKELPGEFGNIIGVSITEPLLGSLQSYLPEEFKNVINKFFEGASESEDFIWRPGLGVEKFKEDDLIIGGTNLMNQKNNVVPVTQTVPTQNILQNNTTTTTKTESTVGGEITFKVVVDSPSSKNISITEANLIGERVAAAIKSRPDLQDEFKKALNFSMNEPKPR